MNGLNSQLLARSIQILEFEKQNSRILEQNEK